jgi:uncharacterized protein (TIGR00255 family)
MTGYGSASVATEDLRASVAVRSLNHRYLDVSVQLPRSLRALEPAVKEVVQGRVRRGRVDVTLQAFFLEEGGETVVASRSLAGEVIRAMRELEAHHGLEGGVTVSDIARFPGVVQILETAPSVDGARGERLLDLLRRALDDLDAMRRAEGGRLHEEIGGLLGAVAALSTRAGTLSEAGREGRQEALAAKVRDLAGELGLDDARLHQEVVRLVDRGDVSEELARLASHVAQARDLLESEEPVGKRLDFLAQELLREANTLGSKAPGAEVIQAVVALKADIERFREQVQNVE